MVHLVYLFCENGIGFNVRSSLVLEVPNVEDYTCHLTGEVVE